MYKDITYRCMQLDFDGDGLLIYKGEHLSTSPSDDDENWWINKFTWTDGALVKIQSYTWTWTGRASYPC